MRSSREPIRPQLQAWAARYGARIGTFTEAAQFAELVVLATAWTGTRNALQLAGPARTAPPRLVLTQTTSGGEKVQHWIPGARVVKVFNTVNAADMVRPACPGGPVEMFPCGGNGTGRDHA